MTFFRALLATDLFILILAIWQGILAATSSLIVTTPGGETTVIPQDHWFITAPTLGFALFVGLVIGAAVLLRMRGRTGLATLLLVLPAVPFVVGSLLTIGLMVLFTIGTPRP